MGNRSSSKVNAEQLSHGSESSGFSHFSSHRQWGEKLRAQKTQQRLNVCDLSLEV